MQVSQPHGPSAPIPGFFHGASNVNASQSVLNHVARNQYNTYFNTPPNEEIENSCLDKLPRAVGAGYSSRSHNTCLQGTREAVLREIGIWEDGKTNESVYWLKGVTGCRKSTIAQTFAEDSAANGRLGASFFCSRDLPDRRNLHLIIPTLAYNLAYRNPAFKTALVPIVRSNPSVEHDALAVQLEKLLVRPLKQTSIPFTIVVDALDECEDKEPVSAFLSALARYIDELPTIKFFITGRPEDHIRSGFMIPSLRTKELPLHDVDSAIVDSDIKSYVETHLNEIATRRRLSISGQWPSDKDIVAILKKCSGLFIIASIIIGFIDFPFDTPQNRLKMILDVPDSTIHEGRSGADVTYSQVFAASFKEVEEDVSQLFEQLRLVLGFIILAFKPLSRAALAKILEMQPETIWNILFRLHSILIVPESDSEAIRICHKSFADFITDRQRCPEAKYYIDAASHHLLLGVRSFELMKTSLMKNICHLPRYVMNDEVKDLDARREKYVGIPLAFACTSWAKHLRFGAKADDGARIIVEVANCFLERHFLSWLEVLSVEGDVTVAIYSLHDVKSCLSDIDVPATNLLNLIDDCERFVLRFFDVMGRSAAHIYHSALPWSPLSCFSRKLYESELMVEAKLLNAVDATWDACVRIIPVDMHVDGVIYSHNGASIAVLGGCYAKVFDTMTGVSRAVFEVDARISSLDFSPDDNLLAYGLWEGGVGVWDLQTGNLVQTFGRHTKRISSVAFSPCGTMIGSGDHDATRIWSIFSGCCERVLMGPTIAVCWSAPGNQVISGSVDGTVRVWDVSKSICSQVLHQHTDQVTAVASLPGSFLVASASYDGTVNVCDLRTGDAIQTISTIGCILCVRFSINGKNLMYKSMASGHIRDLATKTHISTVELDGYCAAFSPDGTYVASPFGRFVKICKTDSRNQHHEAPARRPRKEMENVSFSADGSLLVSRSHVAANFKVWSAKTGVCSTTLKDRYNCRIRSLVLSPNSMFAACLSRTNIRSRSESFIRAHILNLHNRNMTKSIHMDFDTCGIAISSDGSRLVSRSPRHVKLWDLTSHRLLACYIDSSFLRDHTQCAFSMDRSSVFFSNAEGHTIILRITLAPSSPSPPQLPMVFIRLSEEHSHQDVSAPRKYYRHRKNEEWILDQYGRRVLWLPPDERALSMDSYRKKVVLGSSRDEKICIIDFSAVPLL